MRQLVCEGICNDGSVQVFDAHVAESIRHFDEDSGRSVVELPDEIFELGRRFKHTQHLMTNEELDLWTCEACGQERRWGGNLQQGENNVKK